MLPRGSALGSALRSSAGRTAGVRARPQNWRQIGRRYASDHGHGQKSSSDIPWMIGSTVITVPAAAWLWQQGPKNGDHGHGGHGDEHGEHEEGEEHEEKEGGDEESKDEGGEEGKDEGGDEPKDGAVSESKDEGEGKAESKSDDEKPKPDDKSKSDESGSDSDSDEGKATPDTSADESDDTPDGQVKKGKGEKQKGTTRPKTETKGEKDSASDRSGAQHPYLNDPEKSEKGEGITETAKIHGTVDPQRKAG